MMFCDKNLEYEKKDWLKVYILYNVWVVEFKRAYYLRSKLLLVGEYKLFTASILYIIKCEKNRKL